jgi:protein phosphatase 1D
VLWSFAARWKRNKLGDQSTAGTTACTVIFRQDHFYVANVGDSGAVLGE